MTAGAAGGDPEVEAPGSGELRFPAIWLRPGDCLIFDNIRNLHGRTAFTSAGGRHLQGCYADLDALANSLAVLECQEVAA